MAASVIIVGQPPYATLEFVGVPDMAAPVAAGTRLGQLTIAPDGWSGTVRLDGPDADLLTLDGTLRVLVGADPLAEARLYQTTAHANPGNSVEIAVTVAGSEPVPPDPPDPPQPDPENTITLTNRSGAEIADYPLKFGRPFLPGKIMRAPVLVVGGYEIATQSDVKNRHPDGSVAFAIVAAVIPRLDAGESLTLSFGDADGAGNAKLSTEEMLDEAFDFEAVLKVTDAGGAPWTTSFLGLARREHHQIGRRLVEAVVDRAQMADRTARQKCQSRFAKNPVTL